MLYLNHSLIKERVLKMENYKIKVNNEAESNPKTEQGLISGKEALIALANGEVVEVRHKQTGIGWSSAMTLNMFNFRSSLLEFRIKPRTIKLELEIPATFEPKDGDRVWFICDDNDFGYAKSESYGDDIKSFYGWWRTESEIKQVVAALRGAINNG